jgi:cold shock CspA family protein/ribosome-associated translation inhibitor RaiA
MQIPLEVSARRLDLTPALEAELRERAGKLDHLYGRLTSCRIAVDGPNGRRNEGGPYRVRLDITAPGAELVADKEAATLEAALDDAFEAAERQVKDFAERRRGVVKGGEHALRGTVLRLFPEEGYGFLAGEDGSEIYFHRNAVLDPGFERLQVGAPVRYAVEQGFEGPQATTVEPA